MKIIFSSIVRTNTGTQFALWQEGLLEWNQYWAANQIWLFQKKKMHLENCSC